MAPVSLFYLPREIRDIVYKFYVLVDGGLVCDTEAFVNGKLRGKDEPLSLSLVYTCKQIAAEMDRGGIALRLNTITFSTIYRPDLSCLASCFDNQMKTVDQLRCDIFLLVGHSITDSVRREVIDTYPEFVPLLDRMKQDGPPAHLLMMGGDPLSTERHGPYGEPPSVYREFIKCTLRKASKYDDDFQKAIRSCLPALPRNRLPCSFEQGWSSFDVIRHSTELWAIPSERQMDEFRFILGQVRMRNHGSNQVPLRGPPPRDRSKYRFSAAAAAIYFLENTPHDVRKHIRKLILNEDHEAVAHPECHARGLIPFCQTYPIQIERRVNLWSNAFQPDFTYKSPHARCKRRYRRTPPFLNSDQITANVACWVVEALALSSAGMPPAAFSLVLDGDPAPDYCSDVFQSIVQRDVAWQAAWAKSLDKGFLPEITWFERRGEKVLRHGYPTRPAREQFLGRAVHADFGGYWGYFFECFPAAMRDIKQGNSVVRCNFDVGLPWDVDSVVSRHRTWDLWRWQKEWFHHDPQFWETMPPLPEWMSLLEENIVNVEDESSLQ